jgi:hypothetical protein
LARFEVFQEIIRAYAFKCTSSVVCVEKVVELRALISLLVNKMSSEEAKIPDLMKAAVCSKYDDEPENNLQIFSDVPTPKTLSGDQVLVRVKAASINPSKFVLLVKVSSLFVHS